MRLGDPPAGRCPGGNGGPRGAWSQGRCSRPARRPAGGSRFRRAGVGAAPRLGGPVAVGRPPLQLVVVAGAARLAADPLDRVVGGLGRQAERPGDAVLAATARRGVTGIHRVTGGTRAANRPSRARPGRTLSGRPDRQTRRRETSPTRRTWTRTTVRRSKLPSPPCAPVVLVSPTPFLSNCRGSHASVAPRCSRQSNERQRRRPPVTDRSEQLARLRRADSAAKAARVVAALDAMVAAGGPPVLALLARKAGVSRRFIYDHPELRAEVSRRAAEVADQHVAATSAGVRVTAASLRADLENAKARNHRLEADMAALRRRLGEMLGQSVLDESVGAIWPRTSALHRAVSPNSSKTSSRPKSC